MNFQDILNRLNVLTTFMNNVIANSKKIFQLPTTTAGEKLVAVWNEESQRTEQYNLSELIAYVNSINTRIVNYGTIDRDVNEFTFNVGFEWIIQGIEYANTTAVVEDIALASTGNNRIDIAFLNAFNGIDIITGFETTGTAEQPLPPPNTILLKIFVVTDSDVNVEDPPAATLIVAEVDGAIISGVNRINIDGATLTDNGNGIITITISGGGGSQNLQEVLTQGSTAEISEEFEIERDGVFFGFGLLITTEYEEGFFTTPSFYVTDKATYVQCFDSFEGQMMIWDYADNSNYGSYGRFAMALTKNSVTHGFNQKSTITGSSILFFPDNVTNLYPSENDREIVVKGHLNNLIEGLKTKQPVRVATTANITLSGTQTIDGVALSVDDRVLVKDQITQSQNGIYLVKSGAWVRTDDANTATELTNAVVSVLEGTANSGATFRQITTSITLGSSNIVWQTFGAQVPDATPTTSGKMRLYASGGDNENGSIHQKWITEQFALKSNLPDLKELTAEHNLLNQVALQSLGFIHDVVPGTYELLLSVSLSSLAASGNIQFGTLGSATVTNINGKSFAIKQTLPGTVQGQDINTVNAIPVTGASAVTSGVMTVILVVKFSTAGNFIPSAGFGTAPSAGKVTIGSFSLMQKI